MCQHEKISDYEGLWKLWAPMKVKLSTWLAIISRLPTRTFWQACGCLKITKIMKIYVPYANRCVKPVGHVSLRCSTSWSVWVGTINLWGGVWVCPKMVKDLFFMWKGSGLSYHAQLIYGCYSSRWYAGRFGLIEITRCLEGRFWMCKV